MNSIKEMDLSEASRYYTLCFTINSVYRNCVGLEKNFYLFQYKLSYRNETGTNHHGLVSTSV